MTFTNTQIQSQSNLLVSETGDENELQDLLRKSVDDRTSDNRSYGVGQIFITGFWGGIFTSSAITVVILTYAYAIGVSFIQS